MSQAIGDRIRLLRGGRTRREYGALLGVAVGTLAGYEGRDRAPNAGTIARICALENVSADWLLFGETAPSTPYHREVLEMVGATINAAVGGSLPFGPRFGRLVAMLYERASGLRDRSDAGEIAHIANDLISLMGAGTKGGDEHGHDDSRCRAVG
jgi:transcriptional regulator with XRE-family HTH domain